MESFDDLIRELRKVANAPFIADQFVTTKLRRFTLTARGAAHQTDRRVNHD